MLLPSALINNRYTVFIIFILISISSFAQSNIPKDTKCYVIVGAFNLERNAALFKNFLEKKNLKTSYRKNTYRNLYYVYSFESKDREETKNELFKFRKEYSFIKDSWLYAGNFKGPHIPSDQWVMAAPKEPEVVETNNNVAPIKEPASTPPPVEIVEKTEELESTVKVEEITTPPLEENTYRIYINAFDATSLKEISGKFSIIDTERSKTIQDVNTHESVVIKKPSNATNKITVMSNLFDYRRVDHTIDLDEPLTDAGEVVEIIGDTILLNFNLLRFNKGDVMTMWEVYFFKDAAIMKEQSITQLNQLLRMMQSNPKMEIKIHGHTNGNSHGKVLHLSEGDKNFFSITGGAHEEIQASAKTLSEYRSYTIQHWLTGQGISEDRVESVGWGGKKMIYDKHDTQAHKNVRVEIEIIEE